MTYRQVWHDSLICVTWLMDVWHDSRTDLNSVCDFVRVCRGGGACGERIVCVTCQHMNGTCHHMDGIRVTWLIEMCDTTHVPILTDMQSGRVKRSSWASSRTSYRTTMLLFGEYVMPHVRMIHVACMNASCRTYAVVISHMSVFTNVVSYYHALVWAMSHVAHITKSCRTFAVVMSHICVVANVVSNTMLLYGGWVVSHIWMSHVMNESCRTYAVVMSRMGVITNAVLPYSASVLETSHVAHMNESRHTVVWVVPYMCVVAIVVSHSRFFVWGVSHIHESYHTDE